MGEEGSSRTGFVVPAADDELAKQPKKKNTTMPSSDGHDQGAVQLREARLLTEEFGDHADAGLLPRAEELLADDGADHD